jgi:hypothetical protein
MYFIQQSIINSYCLEGSKKYFLIEFVTDQWI